MSRFIKVVFLLILAPTMLIFTYKPALAASRFEAVIAQAALLAEVDSGTVLFDHNMHRQHSTGELTKIMTLLLAVTEIENGDADPSDIVIMTENAWSDINAQSTTREVAPGEEITLLDLMYSAVVGNANEACNMIAEYLSGSIELFVERMNLRAKDIGCENTFFTNPHGQFDPEQQTTARDQFLIFREAMSFPLFLEISGTFRYTVEETNVSASRSLISTNSLLNQNGRYYYRHCLAGMSSVTYEGGHSFVGLSESEGLSLISIVLGSDEVMLEDESYELRNLTETRRLFEWGYANFGMRTIISSNELIYRVPVEHGAGADFVNLRPESSIELLLDNDIPPEEFERSIVIFTEPLMAPIEAGDVLGRVTVSRNGFEYEPILLVANTSIELHRFEYIRMQIAEALDTPLASFIIITLIILIGAYVALVIRYNVIRRKRLAKIKQEKNKLIEERRTQSHRDEFD